MDPGTGAESATNLRKWRYVYDSDHWMITLQIEDPSSRQRGRPTETRPKISDSNISTGSNIWCKSHKGALDTKTYWLTDRPTVSRKVKKKKSRYGWWSVSQYVKVSSPFWDCRPNIGFCPKVIVWKFLSCIYGVPSLTRGWACRLSWSLVLGFAFAITRAYSCRIYRTVQNKIQTTQTQGILLNVQTDKDVSTPTIIAISNRDV
jgi:hypothetical protein